MLVVLAGIALVAGTALFLHASTRIIRHDDGSVGVAVRAVSGFVLLVTVGVIALFGGTL